MDEHTRKRIIAFTSQSVKQYGIRAVRMDIIARHTNVSKRTIYQVFATKDNLINTCLEAYSGRMQNRFQLIAYNNPDPLACLWETCKAYIENLYKGECIFWLDIYRHYQGIYLAINQIWWNELKKKYCSMPVNPPHPGKLGYGYFSPFIYGIAIQCTTRGMCSGNASLCSFPYAKRSHSSASRKQAQSIQEYCFLIKN